MVIYLLMKTLNAQNVLKNVKDAKKIIR